MIGEVVEMHRYKNILTYFYSWYVFTVVFNVFLLLNVFHYKNVSTYVTQSSI